MLRILYCLSDDAGPIASPRWPTKPKHVTPKFTEWFQAAIAGTCIAIGAPPVNTDIMCAGTSIMEDGYGSVADGESFVMDRMFNANLA